MRFIYSFLMGLLTPYLLLRLWWKGRRLPAYKKVIAQRFCWGVGVMEVYDVWVHAVSLGEVIAASPLIEALLENKRSVLVTTMTPTGAAQVEARFAERVQHRWIPYDQYGAVRRFFNYIKPKVGVIMETELWPNLIYEARAAQVPLILANARLSERSLGSYLRFKCFFKPLLNQFSCILAQSKEDGARFISLGADKSLVKTLGNIKFDMQTHLVDSTQFETLKSLWGAKRPVVLLASTHEDEESQILAYLATLQQAIPDVVLLIAPRHPERFPRVYQLALQSGFNTGLRSNPASLIRENEVVVLDSLGELLGWFKLCDYAFVGGSLVPVGGHNVLEPIAMQIPVFSGTQVHNFKAICRALEEAQAIHLIDSGAELIQAIIKVHNDEALKMRTVANATKVLERNKGALARHLAEIEALINSD